MRISCAGTNSFRQMGHSAIFLLHPSHMHRCPQAIDATMGSWSMHIEHSLSDGGIVINGVVVVAVAAVVVVVVGASNVF